MSVKKSNASRSGQNAAVHLDFVGVIILGVFLLIAGGLAGYAWHAAKTSSEGPPIAQAGLLDDPLAAAPQLESVGPWGELYNRDIELEQPQEYALYYNTNRVTTWIFEGMNSNQVRALMLSCGIAADQVGRVLSPAFLSESASNTILEADNELVFSLSPQTREKLYGELGRSPANQLMQFPICFRGNTFDAWFNDGKVSDQTVALLKKLMYARGNFQCFSDLDALLSRLPSDAERTRLTRALSHQSAVLVGLRIRPDTDIDKLLGYWGRAPGVRLIDSRPLLESLKRLTNGGAASILYFLPQFARQRLYTYPLPAQPGDPTIDCHWSTMNFFNETPDDRFADPAYTSSYLKANYYEVAKPAAYGDVIMVVNDHNAAIHSAVYLAGDIVFTKNGNNFRQPWMLMRFQDLMAMYQSGHPPRVLVFRNKDS